MTCLGHLIDSDKPEEGGGTSLDDIKMVENGCLNKQPELFEFRRTRQVFDLAFGERVELEGGETSLNDIKRVENGY